MVTALQHCEGVVEELHPEHDWGDGVDGLDVDPWRVELCLICASQDELVRSAEEQLEMGEAQINAATVWLGLEQVLDHIHELCWLVDRLNILDAVER